MRSCSTAVFVNREPAGAAGSTRDRRTDFLGVLDHEIFHWHNPSDRTMALGSTQPLTEMSTGSISWG